MVLKTAEGLTAVSRGTEFADRKRVQAVLAVDSRLLREAGKRFPVRWPNYYLSLAESVGEPLKRMGRPDFAEIAATAADIIDPVGDGAKRPHPFIVRKHRDRVIVLTTKNCHFYCRFCFRRDQPHGKEREPDDETWQGICRYLESEPEIEEAILSGGDPLTLTNARLAEIIAALSAVPSLKRLRIHTRAPIHYPARIDDGFFDAISGPLPLRMVTHANHPGEITEETERFAQACRDRGIPLLNQAVLLNAVNDNLETQVLLWRELARLGIQAHHLHHPDRVEGNQLFRVEIERGRALYSALCEQLPAEQRPTYVLDLPDGRGKIPVMDLVFKDGDYLYHHQDGTISRYRDFSQTLNPINAEEHGFQDG